MKKEKIFNYYSFGYDYYILKYRSEGLKIRLLQDRIMEFFGFCDDLDLQVTKQAASNLWNVFKEIAEEDPETETSEKISSKIKKILNQSDKTLDSELLLKEAYILTEKEPDLNKLLIGFDKLPSMTKYDFQEAVKCLVFDRPTAAAFHSLRAVEKALRQYYLHIVKRES